MKKFITILGALLFIAVSIFAGGKREKDGLEGAISIAGSSTVYPVTTAIAEEFFVEEPEITIAVQSSGTGGGFKNFFIPGKTAINNASRHIKDSEAEACRENGFEAIEFLVATDAITIVINPEADWVDNITVEQLNMIWRPENPAIKWSDVDPRKKKKKINLYGPTAASGTFDYFTEEIMGEGGASRSDYSATEQDNTIVAAVAGDKYAMGYFGLAYYLENTDSIKALKVEGIMPSLETAKTGEYSPLSRPLFIYVSSKQLERPEVMAFVEFYLSLIDTELISEVGYVPLTTEEADKERAKLK